jgi:NAD dependent epimerase/dehydratase family enzyme
VLDSQRVLPAQLDAAGFTFRYSHIEAALRGLM